MATSPTSRAQFVPLLVAAATLASCSGLLTEVARDTRDVADGGGREDASDAPTVPVCPQAVGTWTVAMPPFGSTSYVITFQISERVAMTGGPVDITWSSPAVITHTEPGAFSVATCGLAESYPVLCASATAAGNGLQCGDTNSSDQDLCPGGDVLTASFDPPTLSWWDAHGCLNGLNCVSCIEHRATSVARN